MYSGKSQQQGLSSWFYSLHDNQTLSKRPPGGFTVTVVAALISNVGLDPFSRLSEDMIYGTNAGWRSIALAQHV